MNPFSQDDADVDKNLYSIATGKRVPDGIREDLLNFDTKGREWCQEFRQQCLVDAGQFGKPIKRRKVKNFWCGAVKKVVKELQGTRYLFGRLLYLSTTHAIDLQYVFTFPLTPVPLSLAHIDGSVHKTTKASLLHKLERATENHIDPQHFDVVIVYAMFLLHTLSDVPITFGAIARKLLVILCSMAPRVDFVVIDI